MKLKILMPLLCTILLTTAASMSAKFLERSTGVPGADPHLVMPSTTSQPIASSQATDRASDEAPFNIQVVLLSLRSEGFEPAELQLPAGEYLLVVKNRTGLDEVDVRLVRENGELLGQTKVGARNKDWKQRLTLNQGTYLLSETNHPDWTSRIVVDR